MGHFAHSDPALVEAARQCALVLSTIGIRLPSLSLLAGDDEHNSTEG